MAKGDTLTALTESADWARVSRWVLSIALFFIVWELLGQYGNLFVVAPATDVMSNLWGALWSGKLWGPTLGTIQIALTGFFLAAAIGLAVGLLVGLSRRAADVLDPAISGAFATPMHMLIPVVGIYIGLEFRGKVFLVVVFGVFVIIINVAAGVREVPKPLVETAKAFGVSGFDMYRKVLLPSAAPYILTGMRLGFGRAFAGAITADLLLRQDNLGLYLRQAAGTYDIPELLAATFFITVLGAGAMGLARLAEWWLLRWQRV